MSIYKRLTQRGDTIAEVLVCLAILSFVLSSAYVLTNRSQQTMQVAHERSEAVKIAESQIELLREYSDDNELPTHDYFCLQESSGAIHVHSMSDNPQSASPSYPNQCKAGPGTRYSYVIWSPSRAIAIGGNGKVFAVTARWEGTAVQQEEVVIFYAIYNTVSPAYVHPHIGLSPAPECSDGIDNSDSEDSLADSADPGCRVIGVYNPNINSEVNPRCNNGVDDDGDSLADYPADTGCTSIDDNDESNPQCSNGIDDSDTEDSLADYPADPGCLSPTDNDESNPPSKVAVYGCYQYYLFDGNPYRLTNHFYTTSSAECPENLFTASGGTGQYEGVVWYAPLSTNTGAIPVYRWYNPGGYDDFYTTVSNAGPIGGWTEDKGTAFYVYPYPCAVAGTVPVYRWYSNYVSNHYYSLTATEDSDEPNNFYAVDGGGTFVYEGILGCVFSNTETD